MILTALVLSLLSVPVLPASPTVPVPTTTGTVPTTTGTVPTTTAPIHAPTLPPDALVKSDVRDFTAFVDDVKTKIVHLEVQDGTGEKIGSGTGFIVRPSGVLVTNEHVVENGHKIFAVFDDKQRVEVTGSWVRDPDHDIAILQLAQKKGRTYKALTLGSSETLRPGIPIAVVGSPLGFSHSLSTGVVSAIRTNGLPKGEKQAAKQRLVQMTAPISPGSSGSPVMLLDGSVIGVATLAFTGRAQALNFAVPIEVAADHLATLDDTGKASPLKDASTPVAPTPLKKFPWINLVITAAVLLLFVAIFYFLRRRERR